MGNTALPTAPELMRRTALWLIGHPITFESLSNGPLGEALTREEIEELADNPQAVLDLLYGMRDTIVAAGGRRRA